MVGIDISDRSIKIVEVSGGRRRALRTVGWSSLSPDIIRRGIIQNVPIAITALQDALAKCSPKPVEGNVVVASIPETQSFVRVLELPAMSEAEIDEGVQWAVRQDIPFDLERVYLDWQEVKDPDVPFKRQRVLVGAVQRDVVDPLLAVLDGAGVRVVALELEAQAIVRSILPLPAHDVRGVLVVDLGASSTNIIFFDQGSIRFTANAQVGGDDLTRSLAHQLDLQPSVAAEQKALVGVQGDQPEVAAALRAATVELVGRIERVVREMQAQLLGERPVRVIMLSGGTANLPGITDIFAQVFPGIPIEMGNPFINLIREEEGKTPPLTAADASHFVTALGLALRREDSL